MWEKGRTSLNSVNKIVWTDLKEGRDVPAETNLIVYGIS